MISAYLFGMEKTISRISNIPDVVYRRLVTVVERLTIKLLGRVKADKLSGQVLNVRTGRLRRSINQRVDSSPTSIIGAVGTNVEYAKVHEKGGTFTIREHVRQVKQVFGRQLITPVSVIVSAHQATYPRRSFLASSLDDMKDEIIGDLTKAAREAARQR